MLVIDQDLDHVVEAFGGGDVDRCDFVPLTRRVRIGARVQEDLCDFAPVLRHGVPECRAAEML